MELRDLDIAGFFGVVIGFEDVRRHKPDPEGVNLALEALGILPAEALVVGDSPADMEAARRAGCRSCHAIWGTPTGVPGLAETKADMVAAAPEDLLALGHLR